jgi:hypothetical protein
MVRRQLAMVLRWRFSSVAAWEMLLPCASRGDDAVLLRG